LIECCSLVTHRLTSAPLPPPPTSSSPQPGYEGRKLLGSLGAENRFFDFEKLAEVTRVVTGNLNKVR
jgi:ribonucleoside-diphosphate reductase subunit M1